MAKKWKSQNLLVLRHRKENANYFLSKDIEQWPTQKDILHELSPVTLPNHIFKLRASTEP